MNIPSILITRSLRLAYSRVKNYGFKKKKSISSLKWYQKTYQCSLSSQSRNAKKKERLPKKRSESTAARNALIDGVISSCLNDDRDYATAC